MPTTPVPDRALNEPTGGDLADAVELPRLERHWTHELLVYVCVVVIPTLLALVLSIYSINSRPEPPAETISPRGAWVDELDPTIRLEHP